MAATHVVWSLWGDRPSLGLSNLDEDLLLKKDDQLFWLFLAGFSRLASFFWWSSSGEKDGGRNSRGEISGELLNSHKNIIGYVFYGFNMWWIEITKYLKGYLYGREIINKAEKIAKSITSTGWIMKKNRRLTNWAKPTDQDQEEWNFGRAKSTITHEWK